MKIEARLKSDNKVIFRGEVRDLLRDVWRDANLADTGCSFKDFSSYDSCKFTVIEE